MKASKVVLAGLGLLVADIRLLGVVNNRRAALSVVFATC